MFFFSRISKPKIMVHECVLYTINNGITCNKSLFKGYSYRLTQCLQIISFLFIESGRVPPDDILIIPLDLLDFESHPHAVMCVLQYYSQVILHQQGCTNPLLAFVLSCFRPFNDRNSIDFCLYSLKPSSKDKRRHKVNF